MRYGIYYSFNHEAEAVLQDLRKTLAYEVAGVPDVKGKMLPHLTLMVFDDVNHASVVERFERFSGSLDGFVLTLKSINSFPGRRNVVYVEPLISDTLRTSYLHCLSSFSSSAIVPSYRDPAGWKPHITLAKNLDIHTCHAAKVIAGREWVPMEAEVRRIGLINVQKALEVLALKILLVRK